MDDLEEMHEEDLHRFERGMIDVLSSMEEEGCKFLDYDCIVNQRSGKMYRIKIEAIE